MMTSSASVPTSLHVQSAPARVLAGRPTSPAVAEMQTAAVDVHVPADAPGVVSMVQSTVAGAQAAIAQPHYNSAGRVLADGMVVSSGVAAAAPLMASAVTRPTALGGSATQRRRSETEAEGSD